MLKQQQQRELSELDRSKLTVATRSEQLIAKYHETTERQQTIVLRCWYYNNFTVRYCVVLAIDQCLSVCLSITLL